jgi:hypothetical protein
MVLGAFVSFGFIFLAAAMDLLRDFCALSGWVGIAAAR